MPRFRFLAADSTGHVRDGTIDAATQTDARNKLATNGLAVRELEEIAADATRAADNPRPAGSARPVLPLEGLPRKHEPRAEPASAPRRASPLPLVLSIIALLVALATAGYVAFREPSNRLSRYDFSTPEDAYRSILRMEANSDFQALLELRHRTEGKQLQQKLDAMRLRRTEECNGKKILFIEYLVDAILTREIAYFERDPQQPRNWRPTQMSNEEIRVFNPSLADEVRNWPGVRTGDFAPMNGGRAAFDK
jgi:hypothetical protein